MDTSAYDERYIKNEWGTRPFGEYTEEEARYFDEELFARYFAKGMKVLEIGFGNGSLISFARDQGCQVTGTEINEVLINKAQAAGFRVCRNLQEIPESGSYDLIVALDVLEHLTAAQTEEALGHVFRLLKPGAKLVARFPNGDSPFGRVYQNGDVTHISDVGRGKIEYYCSILNLELEYLGNPARLEAPGWRRKVKRIVAHAARSAIEWTIAKLYFERTIPFNLNYVAVLRKPSGSA